MLWRRLHRTLLQGTSQLLHHSRAGRPQPPCPTVLPLPSQTATPPVGDRAFLVSLSRNHAVSSSELYVEGSTGRLLVCVWVHQQYHIVRQTPPHDTMSAAFACRYHFKCLDDVMPLLFPRMSTFTSQISTLTSQMLIDLRFDLLSCAVSGVPMGKESPLRAPGPGGPPFPPTSAQQQQLHAYNQSGGRTHPVPHSRVASSVSRSKTAVVSCTPYLSFKCVRERSLLYPFYCSFSFFTLLVETPAAFFTWLWLIDVSAREYICKLECRGYGLLCRVAQQVSRFTLQS